MHPVHSVQFQDLTNFNIWNICLLKIICFLQWVKNLPEKCCIKSWNFVFLKDFLWEQNCGGGFEAFPPGYGITSATFSCTLDT